jgi:uncharacterized protein YkwD
VAGRAIIVAAAVAVALIFGGQGQSAALTRSELSLLQAMNEVRAAHGLAPLRADPRLQRSARGHSRAMLRTQTFSHGAYTARIRGVGVRAPRVGENIAWGSGSYTRARAIVSVWLESPTHRANLLRRGFWSVGVGALRGRFEGRSALMITTDFAGR